MPQQPKGNKKPSKKEEAGQQPEDPEKDAKSEQSLEAGQQPEDPKEDVEMEENTPPDEEKTEDSADDTDVDIETVEEQSEQKLEAGQKPEDPNEDEEAGGDPEESGRKTPPKFRIPKITIKREALEEAVDQVPKTPKVKGKKKKSEKSDKSDKKSKKSDKKSKKSEQSKSDKTGPTTSSSCSCTTGSCSICQKEKEAKNQAKEPDVQTGDTTYALTSEQIRKIQADAVERYLAQNQPKPIKTEKQDDETPADDKSSVKKSDDNKSSRSRSRGSKPSKQEDDEPKWCEFCEKDTHNTRACRFLKKAEQRKKAEQEEAKQSGEKQLKKKWCGFCKTDTHQTANCRYAKQGGPPVMQSDGTHKSESDFQSSRKRPTSRGSGHSPDPKRQEHRRGTGALTEEERQIANEAMRMAGLMIDEEAFEFPEEGPSDQERRMREYVEQMVQEGIRAELARGATWDQFRQPAGWGPQNPVQPYPMQPTPMQQASMPGYQNLMPGSQTPMQQYTGYQSMNQPVNPMNPPPGYPPRIGWQAPQQVPPPFQLSRQPPPPPPTVPPPRYQQRGMRQQPSGQESQQSQPRAGSRQGDKTQQQQRKPSRQNDDEDPFGNGGFDRSPPRNF